MAAQAKLSCYWGLGEWATRHLCPLTDGFVLNFWPKNFYDFDDKFKDAEPIFLYRDFFFKCHTQKKLLLYFFIFLRQNGRKFRPPDGKRVSRRFHLENSKTVRMRRKKRRSKVELEKWTSIEAADKTLRLKKKIKHFQICNLSKRRKNIVWSQQWSDFAVCT